MAPRVTPSLSIRQLAEKGDFFMGKIVRKNKKKIIGVLGGMGPQASSEFHRLLIEKSISKYGVKNNDEFPEILIDSVPVPDFISDTKYLEEAEKMLIDRVKRMSRYPVDYMCIACNTAHILLDKLRSESKVYVFSILEEILNEINKFNLTKIGLLATMTTYRLGLYDKVINHKQIIKPSINDQNELDEIIRGVIAGKDVDNLKNKLSILANKFIKDNRLEAVILGCTELPLIFPQIKKVKILNSLDVLVDAILRKYYLLK